MDPIGIFLIMDSDKDYEFFRARHQLLLEALRHREQEVLKYLAIIGPVLVGFVWLISKYPKEISIGAFCFGSIGLIFTLLLGACYCIALGYNYRVITFQIAKDEENIGVSKKALSAWPRGINQWIDRTRLGHYLYLPASWKDSKIFDCPWCFPPEVISIFWYAFVIGIIYLTVAVSIILKDDTRTTTVVVAGFGLMCLGLSLLVPYLYGRKLRKVCEKEISETKSPVDKSTEKK